MSRMPIRTFLLIAKKQLHQALQSHGSVSFVVGNESADLDSITCALVYGYIQSSTPESRRDNQVMIPVTNIPASDLPLRPELAALLRHADLKPSDLITLDDLGRLPMPLEATKWALVDHNALTGPLKQHYSNNVIGVIDHHVEENAVTREASPRIVRPSGSCSSLIANHLRPSWDDISSRSTSIGAANAQSSDGLIDDTHYTSTWDAQVAKLALGSIFIDTYNLTDESKVTDDDRKAVKYLEAVINLSPRLGKDYDRDTFFSEINAAKSSLDALTLEEALRKDYKQWSASSGRDSGVMYVGISTSVQPLSYLLSSKAETAQTFIQEIVKFAQARGVQLFAVMTAYTDPKTEKFSRELLLLSLEDGEAKEAAEQFELRFAGDLKLEESTLASEIRKAAEAEEAISWVRVWNQRNVAASRKKVAPLLREVI